MRIEPKSEKSTQTPWWFGDDPQRDEDLYQGLIDKRTILKLSITLVRAPLEILHLVFAGCPIFNWPDSCHQWKQNNSLTIIYAFLPRDGHLESKNNGCVYMARTAGPWTGTDLLLITDKEWGKKGTRTDGGIDWFRQLITITSWQPD